MNELSGCLEFEGAVWRLFNCLPRKAEKSSRIMNSELNVKSYIQLV
jgi:hypothetical protein